MNNTDKDSLEVDQQGDEPKEQGDHIYDIMYIVIQVNRSISRNLLESDF